MSSTPPAPVSPRLLCRRILAGLRQRLPPDRELSSLPMLLCYFINLAPGPSEFTRRIERYVTDARPDIAAAAAVIEAAWQCSQCNPPLPPPPLREVLRTLGALVDGMLADIATIEVGRELTAIRLSDLPRERHLDAHALQYEMAAQRALRGQVPGDASGLMTRYEPLLRAIGMVLENQPPQGYTIIVSHQIIGVEGTAGYYGLFPVSQLAEDLTATQLSGAGEIAPADAGC